MGSAERRCLDLPENPMEPWENGGLMGFNGITMGKPWENHGKGLENHRINSNFTKKHNDLIGI
jgi:hypothetical protein